MEWVIESTIWKAGGWMDVLFVFPTAIVEIATVEKEARLYNSHTTCTPKKDIYG